MTIEELYQQRARGEGEHPDLFEHLPTLRHYAAMCGTVTEFGTRTGNSTAAFLASGSRVTSYDKDPHRFNCPEDARARWTFIQADTAFLSAIEPCELLFIDSAHNERQVRGELRQHVHVRQFIILHDTLEWGTKPDGGADCGGINYALFPFLAEQKHVWRVSAHWNNCRGLTVLERIM